MALRLNAYRLFLRAPSFRGKARIEALLRQIVRVGGDVDLPNGLKMYLDPAEWTQRDLLRDGCLEPLTTTLYHKLLRPKDAYIDVGCHVGFHTLVARSLVGAEGRVVAIDPQPYNSDRTLSNCKLNNFTNVIMYSAAIGENPGNVHLPHQPETDRAKLSLLDSSSAKQAPQFSVPVFTLAQILKWETMSRVRLLKIDTEGYELAVLKGLGALVTCVDNVILELLPEARAPEKPGAEICSLLESTGFNLRTVEANPWLAGSELPENNLWACRSP